MYIKTQINCNIGCVRPNNEDMILFAGQLYRDKTDEVNFELGDNVRLSAIVADGMGGHNGGEYASQISCELFDDFVVNQLPPNLSFAELENLLEEWTKKTHATITNKSYENSEYEGMGTTFCGLLFYEKLVLALNIGDSRLYRFREGILKQITKDHSMRELYNNPDLPSNQIYNSLGAGDSAFMDITDISENVLPDDVFLICSDGIVDMMTDEEIENSLLQEINADKLVEIARKNGGKDNISVILLNINY
jgi:protein phosphatase